MAEQLTIEDARKIAGLIRSGQLTGERKRQAMAAIEASFGQSANESQIAPPPELDDRSQPAEGFASGNDPLRRARRQRKRVAAVGEDIMGVGGVAKTIVSGGIGEIVAGFNNTLAMIGGRSVDDAAADIAATSDFFTLTPSTQRGQDFLENIAVPLLKFENNITNFAERASDGNPAAATIIKTAIMGGVELAIPTKNAPKVAVLERQLRAKRRDVKESAEALGIRLDARNLATDVVEAAKRMTPEERAANAPALQKSLQDAARIEGKKRDALFTTARESKTFIETRSVRSLANDIEANLRSEGYPLNDPDFSKISRTLDDMRSGAFEEGASLATTLNNLELVRKSTNRRRGNNSEINRGLNQIRLSIDEFVDNEFNKIAVDQGRSAISGETSGVQAWKDARAANVQWHKNFSEDKVISQLIQEDVSATTMNQWMLGATAMGARKEAVSTIQRLKGVLGDSHPAIEGIRQDFLFTVAEPLFKDRPNFGQFVDRYDSIIRNNGPLVRELGLDTGNFRELLDFARAQRKLPPPKQTFQAKDLTQALSQFFVGHQIAKAGMRVNLTRRLLNAMPVFNIDQVPPRQILEEVIGIRFGEPMLPKKGPLAAEFIAGAALTGLPDTQKE